MFKGLINMPDKEKIPLELNPNEIKTLHLLRGITDLDHNTDVIGLALSCLANNIFAAFGKNHSPALWDPKEKVEYVIALNPKKKAKRTYKSQQPLKATRTKKKVYTTLGSEESFKVHRLIKHGAGTTPTAVVRLALGVFLEVVSRLMEGWELVWVTSKGKIKKQEVQGMKLEFSTSRVAKEKQPISLKMFKTREKK